MTADVTIEATPGQVAAIERDGFLVVAGPMMDCPTCQGAGRWSDGLPCSACRGIRASVENGYRNIDGWSRVPVPTTKPCPECGGSGKRRQLSDPTTGEYGSSKLPCPTCNGDGTVPIVVEVVVPERECEWCDGSGVRPTITVLADGSLANDLLSCVVGCDDGTIPARTILRGTAEAVPVVAFYQEIQPSDVVLAMAGEYVYLSHPTHGVDVTHHFADVPRPEVGDTCWVVKP